MEGKTGSKSAVRETQLSSKEFLLNGLLIIQTANVSVMLSSHHLSVEKILHPWRSFFQGTRPHSPSLKFVGLLLVKKRSLRQSRCDWHVSIGPLGPYILAHRGLTLATTSGLAGKQSWGKVRERGRSEVVAGRIDLPLLQNSPQESWNEVNSMPIRRHDFGVMCGLIWQNWVTGNAAGQLNCSRPLHLDMLSLCCAYFCSFISNVREQIPACDFRLLLLLYSLDTHWHWINTN